MVMGGTKAIGEKPQRLELSVRKIVGNCSKIDNVNASFGGAKHRRNWLIGKVQDLS